MQAPWDSHPGGPALSPAARAAMHRRAAVWPRGPLPRSAPGTRARSGSSTRPSSQWSTLLPGLRAQLGSHKTWWPPPAQGPPLSPRARESSRKRLLSIRGTRQRSFGSTKPAECPTSRSLARWCTCTTWLSLSPSCVCPPRWTRAFQAGRTPHARPSSRIAVPSPGRAQARHREPVAAGRRSRGPARCRWCVASCADLSACI
mmetsp:Transcript_70893/g.200098  ORF Transcript_70893/g.200098 Transcript_70893/m.200098 type:complete len:202 (-) Transcript_70893:77-682(-)